MEVDAYATKDEEHPESVRYSMEEINLIWNQADDPHWNAIRLKVLSMNGGDPDNDKYQQFYDRAVDASVHH